MAHVWVGGWQKLESKELEGQGLKIEYHKTH